MLSIKSLKKSVLLLLLGVSIQVSAQNNITGVTVSLDGNTMIITKSQNDTTAFYQINKNAAGAWTDTLALTTLNAEVAGAKVVDPFLLYSENCLYFSANLKDSKGGMDIYYSCFENGAWGKPVNLGEPINTADNEENPSISADNSQLFFNRWITTLKPVPDDELCRVLQKSTCGKDGKWTAPLPLKLSWAGCSSAPLISPDGKTLYFASNRLANKRKRKNDIFYVKQMPEGIWSTPQALDSLSTEQDEIDIAVDYRNKEFVVLRFDDNKKINAGSLFYYPVIDSISEQQITFLSGAVFDAVTKQPVSALLQISDANTLKVIAYDRTNSEGKYYLVLPKGYNYKLQVSAAKYATQWHNFNTSTIVQNNYTINHTVSMYAEVEILFNVYDKELFTPLSAEISATTKDGKSIKAQPFKNDGQYTIKLPVGSSYTLKVSNADYDVTSIPFNLESNIEFSQLVKDVPLSPVKLSETIYVHNAETKKPIDATLDIRNMNVEEILNVSSINKGEYVFQLRKGNKYSVYVSLAGYSYFYAEFIAGDALLDKELKNIQLLPLMEQTPITFRKAKFEENSTLLTDDSYNDLDKFVQLMLDNSEITVELSAHTDNTANPAYCDKLTAKQAQILLDYIVGKGIVKDRITTKGYGQNFPLLPDATALNKAKNRRCVYTIITSAKEWADIKATEPAFNTRKITTKPKTTTKK